MQQLRTASNSNELNLSFYKMAPYAEAFESLIVAVSESGMEQQQTELPEACAQLFNPAFTPFSNCPKSAVLEKEAGKYLQHHALAVQAVQTLPHSVENRRYLCKVLRSQAEEGLPVWQRFAAPQLNSQSGKYSSNAEMSEEMKRALDSIDPTNQKAERTFAYFDRAALNINANHLTKSAMATAKVVKPIEFLLKHASRKETQSVVLFALKCTNAEAKEDKAKIKREKDSELEQAAKVRAQENKRLQDAMRKWEYMQLAPKMKTEKEFVAGFRATEETDSAKRKFLADQRYFLKMRGVAKKDFPIQTRPHPTNASKRKSLTPKELFEALRPVYAALDQSRLVLEQPPLPPSARVGDFQCYKGGTPSALLVQFGDVEKQEAAKMLSVVKAEVRKSVLEKEEAAREKKEKQQQKPAARSKRKRKEGKARSQTGGKRVKNGKSDEKENGKSDEGSDSDLELSIVGKREEESGDDEGENDEWQEEEEDYNDYLLTADIKQAIRLSKVQPAVQQGTRQSARRRNQAPDNKGLTTTIGGTTFTS